MSQYTKYPVSGGGGGGGGVSSVNTLTGALTLAAGTGITITPSGNTLTIASTGGTGTVTSVGLVAPSILTVSGSPVTTSGSLTLTLATQSPNLVFAGPSSGGAAAPTFRALVSADMPAGLGDVVGPGSAVDTQIALFNGTTGKLIKTSSATVSSAGLLIASNMQTGTAGVLGAGAVSFGDGNGAIGQYSGNIGYGNQVGAYSLAVGYLNQAGVSGATNFTYAFGAKATSGSSGTVLFADSQQNIYLTERAQDSVRWKFASGYEYAKTDIPSNGTNAPTYGLRQFIATTTTATPDTSQLMTYNYSNTTAIFNIKVMAHRTGGSAGTVGDSGCFEIRAYIKNIGNTLTIMQQATTSFADQAWTAAISVSGANITLTVTGTANNNIAWGSNWHYEVA